MGVCGKDECEKKHHPSIHFERRETDKPTKGVKQYNAAFQSGDCMLMANIITARNVTKLTTVWDSGATASVVTHIELLELWEL